MTLIPELRDALRARGPSVCYAKPRLFFAIYYDPPNDDDAFKRAAKFWQKRLEKHGVAAAHDPFISWGVTYERQFKLAWKTIAGLAKTKGLQVGGGQIFSHASWQGDDSDGLEFKGPKKPSDGQTLKAEEIDQLEKLPWSDDGFLILSGCNSGVVAFRGWAPARRFAKAQGIHTVGLPGYGYFSKKWDTYVETTAKDQEIYLWAYRRRRNRLLGDGGRQRGVVFKPNGDQAGRHVSKEDGPFMTAGAPM